MASFTVPFFIPVYFNSPIPFISTYNVAINENFPDGTIFVDRQLTFEEFVSRVNRICKADLSSQKMRFTLVWCNEHDVRQYFIFDDGEYLSLIYFYAFNKPELYVSLRDRTPDCVNLGGSSQAIVSSGPSLNVEESGGFFTCSDADFSMRYGVGPQFSMGYNESAYRVSEIGQGSSQVPTNEIQYSGNVFGGGVEENQGWNETDSDETPDEMQDSDSSADESYIPTDSEESADDIHVPDDHCVYQDVSNDPGHEEVSENEPGRWDGNPDSITAGTTFKSKEVAQNAILLWSGKRGVNYRTVDSKKNTFSVECVTRAPNYPVEYTHGFICPWSTRVSKDRWTGKWKVLRWVDGHSCTVSGSTSHNITQKHIAALVTPHLRVDLGFKVKNVIETVRQHYNITVLYKKAWHGRRLAIEGLYGTWESNTMELPRYMEAVKVCVYSIKSQKKFTFKGICS
jgi:hypothetical protein